MSAEGSNAHTESPALQRGFLDGIVDGDPSFYLVPLEGPKGEAPVRCRLLVRTPGGSVETTAPVSAIRSWAEGLGERFVARLESLLGGMAAEPGHFAGLSLREPLIMGIINVTPDSFSDGGAFIDPETAIAHGRRLAAEGASILDVGGESTRPGAAAVSPDEELGRVLPVVRGLAAEGYKVSIDARRAAVMAAALDAGAAIVNDITALSGDPESLGVVAAAGAPVVLMHMQGEPGTMQDDPTYEDAALDVFDDLERRIAACEAAGIRRRDIAVDPGIGFGKNDEHNLRILSLLGIFRGLGCPILLGASRKSFIGRLSRQEPVSERLGGSIAAALAGISQGVQMVRVHDVAATRQAFSIWSAIGEAAFRATVK